MIEDTYISKQKATAEYITPLKLREFILKRVGNVKDNRRTFYFKII